MSAFYMAAQIGLSIFDRQLSNIYTGLRSEGRVLTLDFSSRIFSQTEAFRIDLGKSYSGRTSIVARREKRGETGGLEGKSEDIRRVKRGGKRGDWRGSPKISGVKRGSPKISGVKRGDQT